MFLERRNALGSREIHPPVRAGQFLPGPGDCVVTRAGGHERGSIGGRKSYPKLCRLFPQRDGGFVGQRKYFIFSPPRSNEEPLPYDSERMPFRPGLPIPVL
ncbi:MAG: hypothetical protein ABH969_11575 [Pseudomonadota bacterium]